MNFNKIFKAKKFFAFDAFGKFPDSGTKEDKAFLLDIMISQVMV